MVKSKKERGSNDLCVSCFQIHENCHFSHCVCLRTVQLKACDAGKATDVTKLLQEAKEANDPVRGTAADGLEDRKIGGVMRH